MAINLPGMRIVPVVAVVVLAASTQAQQLFDPATLDRIAATEARGHHLRSMSSDAPTRGYDVRYLRLEWTLDPAVRAITGTVTTWFSAISDSRVKCINSVCSSGVSASSAARCRLGTTIKCPLLYG